MTPSRGWWDQINAAWNRVPSEFRYASVPLLYVLVLVLDVLDPLGLGFLFPTCLKLLMMAVATKHIIQITLENQSKEGQVRRMPAPFSFADCATHGALMRRPRRRRLRSRRPCALKQTETLRRTNEERRRPAGWLLPPACETM